MPEALCDRHSASAELQAKRLSTFLHFPLGKLWLHTVSARRKRLNEDELRPSYIILFPHPRRCGAEPTARARLYSRSLRDCCANG